MTRSPNGARLRAVARAIVGAVLVARLAADWPAIGPAPLLEDLP